ncbi:hypothetical protein CIT25_23255 [Mesorhizobium mediterraneum]|uniref:Uncharacterized protein n=1 Tax=Mesorhizobium mediterraneum TaxID=43617 RepID=A0AB36R6B1_9HYPH|nr:DUF4142 domain-containing protein [Mesorhizobium sp.]PAP99788.1 hypothetical protein CIT25_23255 [Mesorhizobium mediterraneum]
MAEWPDFFARLPKSAAFDLAYISGQITDHQRTAQLLEWEIGSGQDTDLQHPTRPITRTGCSRNSPRPAARQKSAWADPARPSTYPEHCRPGFRSAQREAMRRVP